MKNARNSIFFCIKRNHCFLFLDFWIPIVSQQFCVNSRKKLTKVKQTDIQSIHKSKVVFLTGHFNLKKKNMWNSVYHILFQLLLQTTPAVPRMCTPQRWGSWITLHCTHRPWRGGWRPSTSVKNCQEGEGWRNRVLITPKLCWCFTYTISSPDRASRSPWTAHSSSYS